MVAATSEGKAENRYSLHPEDAVGTLVSGLGPQTLHSDRGIQHRPRCRQNSATIITSSRNECNSHDCRFQTSPSPYDIAGKRPRQRRSQSAGRPTFVPIGSPTLYTESYQSYGPNYDRFRALATAVAAAEFETLPCHHTAAGAQSRCSQTFSGLASTVVSDYSATAT